MHRQFISVLIGLTVIISLNGQVNRSTHENNYPWFPFTWYGDSINDKWYDKCAIVLPFGASGRYREIFTIQLDSGCDWTFFENEEYLNSNKLKKEDLKKILLSKIDSFSIQTFFSKMDKELRKQFSCDSLTTRKVNHKHLGIIGSDLFENKILIIDYPNTRLCILDSIDENYKQNFILTDMDIKYKLPVIPININNQKKWLTFDTGSSCLDIHTSKIEWDSIVNKSLPVDTFGPANSWGTLTYFFGSPIPDKCDVGGYRFQKCKIWYSNNERIENMYRNMNIFGLTGNALYLDKVIMIDYKNKSFGIKKN